MAKAVHPNFAAAKMAASDFKDLLGFIKDSEFGSYPGGPEPRKSPIESAPDDVRSLEGSYPRYFVERLARLAREEES